MKYEYNGTLDFGNRIAQTYKKYCECGKIIEISTHADLFSETFTNLHVKCQTCGMSIHFTLPVEV